MPVLQRWTQQAAINLFAVQASNVFDHLSGADRPENKWPG